MNNLHRNIAFPEQLVDHHQDYIFGLIKKYNLSFNEHKFEHYKFPSSELPANFVNWFEKEFVNLYIKDWEIFYSPPGRLMGIHSDGFYPFIDFIKLNYVYQGNNSLMKWYKLKNNVILEKKFNKHLVSTTPLNYEQTDFVFQAPIGLPSLVNVGVPHSVDNVKNIQGRWCISLIPNFKNNVGRNLPTTRVMFDEALDIFKKYIQD